MLTSLKVREKDDEDRAQGEQGCRMGVGGLQSGAGEGESDSMQTRLWESSWL